jgi:hypothetical protein
MARTEFSILNESVRLNDKKEFGQGVVTYIKPAKRHVGPFYALYALSESVIDTTGCWQGDNLPWGCDGNLPGTITVPAGTMLYGNYNDIELDSGIMIGYSLGPVTIDDA